MKINRFYTRIKLEMFQKIYLLFVFLVFIVLHVLVFDLILYFSKGSDVIIVSFSVAITLAFLSFIFFFSYKKIEIGKSVSLSLNVCFVLFFLSLIGPIFIDKSDAYRIIENVSEGKSINLDQYQEIANERDMAKLFEENARFAKLKKIADNVYEPTKKTFYLKKITSFFNTIYFPNKRIVIRIE